jgi:hypothetical protein
VLFSSEDLDGDFNVRGRDKTTPARFNHEGGQTSTSQAPPNTDEREDPKAGSAAGVKFAHYFLTHLIPVY